MMASARQCQSQRRTTHGAFAGDVSRGIRPSASGKMPQRRSLERRRHQGEESDSVGERQATLSATWNIRHNPSLESLIENAA